MIYITGCSDAMGAWVHSKTNSRWIQGGGEAFGVADDKGIACGAAFTDYNGTNVFVSIAADRPTGFRWLLWAIGHYGFVQLGCSRLTFVTESSNINSVRFQERLGAIHEATLKGAGRRGDDILISRLTPDAWIWRKLDGKQRRKCTITPELCTVDPPSGAVKPEPVQHDAGCFKGQFSYPLRHADVVSAGGVSRARTVSKSWD